MFAFHEHSCKVIISNCIIKPIYENNTGQNHISKFRNIELLTLPPDQFLFSCCLCVPLYVAPHYPKGFCVTTTAAVTIQRTEVTEFSISFCEMNMLFVVASCVAE